MTEPAKRYQDELPRLKKSVEQSRAYYEDNYKRYNNSKRFVFSTSLSDDDASILASLNKPAIEFNIMEAFVSRLRGEFSKQEPSISVSAADDAKIDLEQIKVVEGHVRHILFESNKGGCEYHTYSDTLSGGFSVWKVWTEYAHDKSFEQIIKFNRVYDPTLTGFDPLARMPTKCDGRFAYEIYPKTKEEMKQDYPEYEWDNMKISGDIGGFTWTYKAGNDDIILVCDYYEKKKKKVKIIKLADGRVLTKKEYEEELVKWQEEGRFEQPPAIAKERTTEIVRICRYIFVQDRLLGYEETDFDYLPLVFVDGNSVILRDSNTGPVIQMTRPYTYHLEGMQKLKNFAGQCLGSELQSMVQHKFKVAKESIPPQYADAYMNYQVPSVIVYNAFYDNDPKSPIPPPMEIARPPIPPEIMGTFSAMDGLAQTILGSYDASLGVNDNQLSGVAIVEGATQSNSAAMPYVVGFLLALNQVANIIVSLLPKYYVTPRTIPVLDADSRRNFVMINHPDMPGSIQLNYDKNALNVKVEAGVNFSIQKSKSLQQIIGMSQASQTFGSFINEKGLRVIVNNMEIKDADQLQVMADDYMNELAEMKKQAQQQQAQQQQNNPLVQKLQQSQQELQLRAQKMQMDAQQQAAKIGIDQQKTDNDRLRIMMEAKQNHDGNLLTLAKQNTEKERAAVDLALGLAGHHHQVHKDIAELHHKINHNATA